MKVEWSWGEREKWWEDEWVGGRGRNGDGAWERERGMNNEYLNEERERDRMKDK